MDRIIDLAIIGGGSAGMAAALEARKEGIKDIVIFEKDTSLGGILLQCIHSGFGLHEFGEQLTGPEFAARFEEKVKEEKIEYKLETTVLNISKDKVITYSNPSEGLVKLQAKAIILASGCRERTRGNISIPGTRPSGVMSAGVAQHYLNLDGYMPGKRVFILGSGDIGLIMARRMSLEGATVLGVAELMPYSNGLNRNIVQCLQDYNIPLYLSHTVTKIFGNDRLEGIELCEVDEKMKAKPETAQIFDCDLLLLSVGLVPDTDLLRNINVTMHPRTKGSLVNESLETSIPGIFSCGNCLHVHDLVDFVAKEARKAGNSAARYLKNELEEKDNNVVVKNLNGVGYVVPSLINKDNVVDNVNFNFRVSKPMKNVWVYIKANGEVISKLYKQAIIPSEMEAMLVSKDKLPESGEITVEVSE